MAELVPVRMPQKIQQEQVVFAGGETGTAPDHLRVQGAYLRRPEHNDAVDRGAVPALCQQHGIAEHIIASLLKALQNLRAVPTFPVHLRCQKALLPQDIPEFPACFYKGQENNRPAPAAVFPHLVRDLAQVRVERGAKVRGLKIARLRPHAGQIELQWDGLRLDRRKIALPDRLRKGVLVGKGIKHRPKVLHVPAVRRRRHAEHLCFGEMPKHLLITVRNAVMCLIYDNGVEIIGREPTQPAFPHHRLDGADHNPEPAAEAGLLRLFYCTPQPRSLCELVCRLRQKLPAVRQNQDTLAAPDAVLRDLCEHDGLAAAGGQHEQGPRVPLFPFRKDRGLCLLLIWPEFHQKSPAFHCGAVCAPSSGS